MLFARKKVCAIILGLCTFGFVSAAESDTQRVDWGNYTIHSDDLWKQGITGKGINVAIIDNGVDSSHEDLKEVFSKIYKCFNKEECVEDDDRAGNHGTHVAGIIAANDNNLGYKGIAYNSKIYAYNVFDRSWMDSFFDKEEASYRYIEDITHALEHIYHWNETHSSKDKISIVNMSIGGFSKENLKDYEEIINRLYKQGVLVVAASGNSFLYPYDMICDENLNTEDCNLLKSEKKKKFIEQYKNKEIKFPNYQTYVTYPGRFENVITVGNIDTKNERHISSSTGPELDVVAPGTDIYSTMPNNEYDKKYGTSMATPYVSGLLALYKEMLPHYDNKQLTELLYKTAKPINKGYVDAEGNNWEYGKGLVQAVLPQEAYVGIMDEVTGKTIQTKGIDGNPQYLFNNRVYEYSSYERVTFKPQSFFSYSFEGKVKKINGTFLQSGGKFKDDAKLKNAKLTIEFLDKDFNVIEGSKRNITRTGWYLFEKPVNEDVYGFKLNNESDSGIVIDEFDLTGVFDIESVPEQLFTSYLPIKDVTLKIYDSHYITSAKESKTFSGVYYLKTQKAFQFNHIKTNHNWYQFADDETNQRLGIANKWFQSEELKSEGIFKYGLLDYVYGRPVSHGGITNVYYVYNNDLSTATSSNATFDSNKTFVYGFEKPVAISSMFLNVNPITNLDEVKPILKMYDQEGKQIGEDILLSKENLFKKYFVLPHTYENVSQFSVTNTSSSYPLWVDEIEFYGDFQDNTKSFPFQSSFYFLQDTFKTLYEQPSEMSPVFIKRKFLEKEELFVQEVAGYNEFTKTFEWYKIDVPSDLERVNDTGIQKWIKLNPKEIIPGTFDPKVTNMKPLYKNGIMDSVPTIYEKGNRIFFIDRIKDNEIYTGSLFNNGYAQYSFAAPVTIKTMYFDLSYGSKSNSIRLELLDENQNVIFTYHLTAQDMFDRYFNISDTPIEASGFRLTNMNPLQDADIVEMEFFQ